MILAFPLHSSKVSSVAVAFTVIALLLTPPVIAQGRLEGFAVRLGQAEQRIVSRRNARQPGEAGGDVPFGTRAEARLLDAIRRYEEIAKRGGWRTMKLGKPLKLGDHDVRIPELRRRLTITSDLDPASHSSDTFDKPLHDAVVRFQTRHGLPNQGIVANLTIAAMNVSAEARLVQLRKNLTRTRRLANLVTPGRSIVVNIPAYELQAMTGDQVAFSSRVIVGRVDRKTPEMSAEVHGITLLPTWRVPPGITRRDMIPKLTKDPEYFARENVRVVRVADGQPVLPGSPEWLAGSAETLRFEQAPGPKNALGLIRIDMPNRHVVYLHDTPTRDLFAKPARPFSSGCVRTEKIAELALWLLADQPGWNAASLTKAIDVGKSRAIKLTVTVPVHLIYLTSWIELDGDVHFREDVYRKDSAGPAAELYEKRETPPQRPTP